MENNEFINNMNTLAIAAIILADIISIRTRMSKGRLTNSDLMVQLFFIVPATLFVIFSLFTQFVAP